LAQVKIALEGQTNKSNELRIRCSRRKSKGSARAGVQVHHGALDRRPIRKDRAKIIPIRGRPIVPQAETLAHQPLFAGLAAADIASLDAKCRWRRIEGGQWLLDVGQGGTDVFFVLQGRLRVMLPSAGREVILRDLAEGDVFGELAAIDGGPRSAGIVALTSAVVGRMQASHFLAAVHQHPSVCDRVLRRLASEIRKLANQVDEFSNLTVGRRLRAELLRMAKPRGQDERIWIISPPPTHAELAARIATHREGVTRELKALERAGLVERRRGALALLDLDALRRAIKDADD
jgi:CRP/FNR family cyclic AMP-dependent transcriptional regulator